MIWIKLVLQLLSISVCGIHIIHCIPVCKLLPSVLEKKQLTVCSMCLSLDLNFSTDELQTPFLFLGDFNAHRPIWGGQSLDGKGQIIEDINNSNTCAK